MSETPLHARHGGDGDPVLVLVHGLGATGAVWDGLLPHVEATWPGSWLVPDLRGHGRSPGGRHYGFGQHAADVAALVEPGRPIVAVGHSMGGVVALALASGWFGLAATCTVAIGVKVAWSAEEAAGMAVRAEAPVRTFPSRAEAVARYLKVAGLDGLVAADSAFAESGVTAAGDGWRLASDPRTMSVGPPPMPALLGAARGRVLLVCGEHDPLVSIDELRALDPAAGILPGLGHNAHVEDPAAMWRVVEEATR